MTSSEPSTATRVSPDSGEPWATEGAWPVAPGIHRIPLPLPMDGLRAVNVYVLEADEGLTLIDGGWAIPAARDVFERSLALLGAGLGDLRGFLVTHAHRDHYTLARVLGTELGIGVTLGAAERPTLELLLDGGLGASRASTRGTLVESGAEVLAQRWDRIELEEVDRAGWRLPDRWLDGDTSIEVGSRTLEAVHTPGHTPGHFVYADRSAGLLFSGDHVLPTITPSIGFTAPPPPDPLGDFLASLARVRALPDLQVLPAHGPLAPSSHARVDELLAHHEERLALALSAVVAEGSTAYEVAAALPWTRRDRAFADLDLFNQSLATRETHAHLEVLAARGALSRTADREGVVVFQAAG